MSAPKLIEQYKSRELRRSGHTISEISSRLDVSKGSVSVWTRNVQISDSGKEKLNTKKNVAREKAAKANRLKRLKKKKEAHEFAKNILANTLKNKETDLVLAAVMYWCEGSKSAKDLVQFTNSDPKLVATFLSLLRKSFRIDEEKFRICMHLHSYHNEKEQKDFWSKVTSVHKDQFIKSHQKKNTAKRVRENYQGCVSVRYYDKQTARILLSLAKKYLNQEGSIG